MSSTKKAKLRDRIKSVFTQSNRPIDAPAPSSSPVAPLNLDKKGAKPSNGLNTPRPVSQVMTGTPDMPSPLEVENAFENAIVRVQCRS